MPTLTLKGTYMKRNILNIVNFLRGTEPRTDTDIHKPFLEQLRLMKENNLRGTFLLQYDALTDPFYTDILKELPPEQFEIGVWFEVVESLCAPFGVEWKGRWSWDYWSEFSFTGAYTFDVREKMADKLFHDFKEVFGYYPRSLGAWCLDAHSIAYISEKYDVDAYCNCKDQFGTDGYTLIGGYYGQAYYPSRSNNHCPASSEETRIDTPVFRMLGSDPIYQYDWGMSVNDGADRVQSVVSLEPVYNGAGGGVPSWVDWYMKENFNGKCLSFSYAQAGQENSFGWDGMKNGLEYQFPLFSRLEKEGKIELMTLSEAGRYFRSTYKDTPASTIVCDSDWKEGEDHKTVWYCSKNYRVNLLSDHDKFRIRDVYLFDDRYHERYLTELCTTHDMYLDNLPVMDGNIYTGSGILAGIFPVKDGREVTFTDMKYDELSCDTARVEFLDNRKLVAGFTLSPGKVEIDGDCEWEYRAGEKTRLPVTLKGTSADRADFSFRGFEYSLRAERGHFDGRKIIPQDGKIVITKD